MSQPIPRSTSLTLDEARDLATDVARAAEESAARAVRDARAPRWKRWNAAAIADYNRFIDATGVPLAEYRKF